MLASAGIVYPQIAQVATAAAAANGERAADERVAPDEADAAPLGQTQFVYFVCSVHLVSKVFPLTAANVAHERTGSGWNDMLFAPMPNQDVIVNVPSCKDLDSRSAAKFLRPAC